MGFVRRRPLMRAAAIGGVAYMGSKAGANRANQQAAAQQQQAEAPAPPPPPPAAGESDKFAQIKQLAELKDAGALTEEEFTREKAKILG